VVGVALKVGKRTARVGILRLRKAIRFSKRLASLRMTEWLLTGALAISTPAFATTYYVSSSTGSDANNGTSSSSAWQTIGHVNAQTFQPGDSIVFKRGDVWNESLIVPSSGSSGNPVTFDAYGTGPAPNLTGYYAVPASGWLHVSGNAWKAPLPSTYSTINFCLFGSIWGQKVGASTTNLTAQWNFYFANDYVYVYATENPSLFYNEPIVPMALSNVPVINTNGQSWLTFQHFLVNWFDQYGVYAQGTSDHLVFANMESDSMIPQGTQPLGFYVNEASPGPGDVKIYNDEAHLNYDGFRFDGAATAITMVNDKAYANRDGALVDNTSAVTYSYCHFYASSLAVAGSTDVEWTSGTGPSAGAGNIAVDTAPAAQVWKRYPAEITLTVDDEGMTPGADTYYAGTVLPLADAAAVPVGAAITVGYPLAQTLISEFQGWINAGRDVTSHSISHTYYTNTDAVDIQYTGSGTAATLSISNKTLTITVTGASDSVSYNLAQGQPQGTMLGLAQALAATGKYTYSFMTPCQGPYGTGCAAYTAAALLSQDLADVSGQDVKSAVYHLQLDVTRLTTDEITLSRQWMTANLTGLPATPIYVYPGGYETTTMQGIAEGVPYSGARGALKEDFGVKDTYADGFNAENITSFGVNPTWMGIPPALLNQHIQALVWKEQVWGVPWGIFWHLNELTQNDPVGGTEITNLIQDFKNSGATIQTNTGLVNWLMTGTQETGTDGNYYYTFPATSMTLDFRPTENSPVVDAGQNLGPAYALDINGVNQNSYGTGWEIGAHVYDGYSVYGGGSGSWFSVGAQPPAGAPQLPQAWVDNNEATDGLVYNPPQYELNLQTQSWVTGPPANCTFNLPYWVVGSQSAAGLQSAVNDAEACRTASGGASGIILDIPPAVYAFSQYGLIIPQSSNSTSSVFNILRSTADSNLPDGRTVCSHGIQDNIPESTDIGLNNPDCTGQNMYYATGPSEVLGQTSGQVCASMTGSGSSTVVTFTQVSAGSAGVACPGAATGTWPSTFTAGTVLDAFGIGPCGSPNTCAAYNTQYVVLSVSTSTSTLTATPMNCLTPSGGGWTCTTGLAPVSGSAVSGQLYANGIISGITTLSANSTTLVPVTSAEVSAGNPVLIPLANGFVAAGTPVTIDTGSNQETVTTVSGSNQIGILATFAKAHAAGVAVTSNIGSFTLANGTPANTSAYDDLEYMWQVTGANSGGITFCTAEGQTGSPAPQCASGANLGPDHWLIEDAAVSQAAGDTADLSALEMGSQGTQTSVSQIPTHNHLRKLWVHGDWTSLFTGANSVSDAIHEHCIYCSTVDSQISQIARPGQEGHSFGYGYGSEQKNNHNWAEGGSSCSLVGGFGNTVSIPNLLAGHDMEWRRNRCTFAYAWLGLDGSVGYNADPHVSGNFSLLRKNGFEMKEGNRYVIQGNILENVSNSGGQDGKMAIRRVSNCSGGCSGQPGGGDYWNIDANDYEVGNIYRNGCDGIGLQGRSDQGGNGYGATFGMANMLFQNDLVYNVSYDNNPGCPGSTAEGWSPGSGDMQWQGTITEDPTGTYATFVAICTNQVSGNCPGGPLPIGWQQASVSPDDLVQISGCTLFTGFNTPTVSSGHATIPGVGVPALLGTAPTSNPPTIVFPSTSVPANSVDNSGNCTFAYAQGWPQNLQVDHVTSILGDNYAFGSGADYTAGPPYWRAALLRDSIFIGAGGLGNESVGEGTVFEQFAADTNTFGIDHTVWPTRTAANYTEYGNNSAYPDSAGCTGGGCSPPMTMYFPSSSCLGWVGTCYGSVPLTYPDYHDFALLSSSSFYAGNSQDASDGTSIGANISVIDDDQTLNQFVCPYFCGSPGPYEDVSSR
jgi:hypothetical protein